MIQKRIATLLIVMLMLVTLGQSLIPLSSKLNAEERITSNTEMIVTDEQVEKLTSEIKSVSNNSIKIETSTTEENESNTKPEVVDNTDEATGITSKNTSNSESELVTEPTRDEPSQEIEDQITIQQTSEIEEAEGTVVKEKQDGVTESIEGETNNEETSLKYSENNKQQDEPVLLNTPEAKSELISRFEIVYDTDDNKFLTGEGGIFNVVVEISDQSEELDNIELKVNVPSEYLSMLNASDISSQQSKVEEVQDGITTITYTFAQWTGGTSLSIPFSYTTDNGLTPQDYAFSVSSSISANSEEVATAESDERLYTYYTPGLRKGIKRSTSSGYDFDDGRVRPGGEEDPNKDGYIGDLDETDLVTFSYEYTDRRRDEYGGRTYEKLVVKDTLPEGAVFVADENPGWEYDEETQTVTYTSEVTQTPNTTFLDYLRDQQGRRLTLNLRFPGHNIEEELINSAEMELTPTNMLDNETVVIDSDDIMFKLDFTVPIPATNVDFNKTDGTTYYDIMSSKVEEGSYTINLENNNNRDMDEPLDMNYFKIRDYDLDERMNFTRIEITPDSLFEGTMTVQAFDNNGNLILEEAGISDFPATVNIPADTEEFTVESDEGAVLKGGQFFYDARVRVQVYVEIVDPENTKYDVDGNNNRFYNYASIEGAYENNDYNINGTSQESIDLRPYNPEIELVKENISGDSYFLNEEVDYRLTVGTSDRRRVLDIAEPIVPKVLVDLLPRGLEYIPGSTSSNIDAIEVEPEIVNNYKGTGRTALLWSFNDSIEGVRDDLYISPSRIHSLLIIDYSTRVTELTEPGINENTAYFVWDNFEDIKPTTPVEDELNLHENNLVGNLVLSDSADMTYIPPRELITNKLVRGSEDSNYMLLPNIGEMTFESEASYRLTIFNNLTNPVSSYGLVDVLPHIDDNQYSPDSSGDYIARNSDFGIKLTKEIIVPDGFAVYYSMSRPEGEDPSDYYNGDHWITEVDDFSNVQAFKIEMLEGRELESEEIITIDVPFVVPFSPDFDFETLAFNSFGSTINGRNFFESNSVGVELTPDLSSITLIKEDGHDAPEDNTLAGAEYRLETREGEVIGEGLTTDENGILYVSGLEPGSYHFVETRAPNGYIIDTQPIEFVINPENENTTTLTHLNYQGSVRLLKVNGHIQLSNQSGPTPREISGAVFRLETIDGTVLMEEIESDNNGWITVSGLAPGDYRFVETEAPEGYILNTEPLNFTIEESAEGEPEVVDLGGFANYQGSVMLTKVDENSEPLAGAVFQLESSDGTVLREGLVSNEEGHISVEGLAPGDYRIFETEAPEGYILNTEVVTFTIEESTEGEPEVVTLGSIMNYQGTVTFLKVNGNDTPLEGAVFKLQDSEGKVLRENIISNENGEVVINHLTPGEYQLVEIKAPEGYLINTTPRRFSLASSAEGEPEMIVLDHFNNYQGVLNIQKVDEETEPLEGAVFTLRFADGSIVKEGLTSDVNGQVIVEGLAPGDYQLIETKAPEGYLLNETIYEINIPSHYSGVPADYSIEIINEIKPVEDTESKQPIEPNDTENSRTPEKPGEQSQLPQTGFEYNWLIIILGLLLTSLGISRYVKKSRN